MSPCIQIQGPLWKAFRKRCEAVCTCAHVVASPPVILGNASCLMCEGPPGGSPKAELSPSVQREAWRND